MFDDDQGNTKSTPPPANLPSEPVDMFAEFEGGAGQTETPVQPNAIKAGFLKPKAPGVAAPISANPAAPSVLPPSPAPATVPTTMYTVKEPILGKIILIIITGVLIVGIAYGGYWFYTQFNKSATPATTPADSVTPEELPPAETPVTPPAAEVEPSSDGAEVSQQQKNDQILFGEPIDSDRDGLDDVREKQLGTNHNNPDSDGDALSDGDEVLVWKTDPMNRDSDGDSYLDGEEVANGYNPLGPGKLNLTTSASATSSAK